MLDMEQLHNADNGDNVQNASIICCPDRAATEKTEGEAAAASANDDGYISTPAAAIRAKVTTETIRRWIREGLLQWRWRNRSTMEVSSESLERLLGLFQNGKRSLPEIAPMIQSSA
jgi:hypothetical protein